MKLDWSSGHGFCSDKKFSKSFSKRAKIPLPKTLLRWSLDISSRVADCQQTNSATTLWLSAWKISWNWRSCSRPTNRGRLAPLFRHAGELHCDTVVCCRWTDRTRTKTADPMSADRISCCRWAEGQPKPIKQNQKSIWTNEPSSVR